MNEVNSKPQLQPSIMLVTRNLPPLRGGMERLNQHIAVEISTQFALQVIGPQGCTANLPDVVAVTEVDVRPLWRFLSNALIHSLRVARKVRPRLVIAGSGLTAPIAVLAAWFVGGRSAVYAHGLDLVVSHPVYKAFWLPFLRRCDLCMVNSRHTAMLASQAGVRPERISILHPGISLPLAWERQGGQEFRQRHGLVDKKILLSVGRQTERKGLLEFVRYALPQIVAAHADAILVVIGDEAPDALHRGEIRSASRLSECAQGLELKDNLLILGVCSDGELGEAYSAADLCVFPLREIPGDVEGFGMVAVEAAAHGLCTVAFDVGGVADAIAEGHSGWLIKRGEYSQLAKRIIEVLGSPSSRQSRQKARDFAASFVWSKFGQKLRTEIKMLLKRPAGDQ